MRWTLSAYHRFWSKVALPNESGCMLWMAGVGSHGYGTFSVNGQMWPAHRVSLLMSDGEPELGLVAAHGCRQKLCVAPSHLRWATVQENAADRKLDGTETLGERHGNAILTTNAVLDIRRRRAGGVSSAELAKAYGVSCGAINDAVAGRRWGWLESGDAS